MCVSCVLACPLLKSKQTTIQFHAPHARTALHMEHTRTKYGVCPFHVAGHGCAYTHMRAASIEQGMPCVLPELHEWPTLLDADV